MTETTLISLNIGTGQTYHWRNKTVRSAIVKHPVFHALTTGTTGLEGDEQIDTQNHGGADKAMLIIPADNYVRFGVHKHWGFLGENLTFPASFSEAHVRLGDHFEIGETLLEVTQPRSPCWKLDELTKTQVGKQHFLQTYANSGHVGYYVRVLKGGRLTAGMPIKHLSSQEDTPTIQALFLAKHGGGKTPEQQAVIEQALASPALSAAWRTELANRLQHA